MHGVEAESLASRSSSPGSQLGFKTEGTTSHVPVQVVPK